MNPRNVSVIAIWNFNVQDLASKTLKISRIEMYGNIRDRFINTSNHVHGRFWVVWSTGLYTIKWCQQHKLSSPCVTLKIAWGWTEISITRLTRVRIDTKLFWSLLMYNEFFIKLRTWIRNLIRKLWWNTNETMLFNTRWWKRTMLFMVYLS